MINANVIRAIQDLLKERGIEQKPNERLGDYVARGLGISDSEAEAFLEAVHDGASIEEAERKAGISIDAVHRSLLIDIARAIGSAMGRLTR